MPSSSLSIHAPRMQPSGCPGLLRIVAAMDGGICRVRLNGGELTTAQARAIADASERFSGGVIELTNRANLQLRGVRHDGEAPLIDALLVAGLGPSHDGGDEVRNLMLSPTAGIDTAALIDTRPLARQLLDRLQQDFGHSSATALKTSNVRSATDATLLNTILSPKFAVQLDGGEALAMSGHHHDIWLSARLSGKGNSPQHVVFGVGVAGSPPVAMSNRDADTDTDTATASTGHHHPETKTRIVAIVTAAQVPDLVSALIRSFLAMARPDETRLRHLLARVDVHALFAHAQASLTFALQTPPRVDTASDAGDAHWCRGPIDPHRRFGAVIQRSGSGDPRYHLGAQPPLGRLTPGMLRAVATSAERFGDGTLRLTPWQGLIIPSVKESDRERALADLRACGLIDSPTDPLGAVLACAGRPDCAKAHADTKQDARVLAKRLRRAVDVQLSGCERGCAAGRPTAYTLLAVADGRYDLYRAHDGQRTTSHFGVRVASDLTVETAAPWLESSLP